MNSQEFYTKRAIENSDVLQNFFDKNSSQVATLYLLFLLSKNLDLVKQFTHFFIWTMK